MLSDTNAGKKILKLRYNNKGLFEKIKDWISDFVDKIKAAYKGIKPDSEAGRMFQKTIKDLEQIEDLFAQAVNNAIESGKGTGEGERYSSKYSKKKVDSVATTRYNSSISWVYDRKIFTVGESKLFHQKISEINQGSKAFVKSADGDYMLPVENKIVFTDGDYSYPQISKIIEVVTDYAETFEAIKECVFDVEKGLRAGNGNALSYEQSVFGEGSAIFYTKQNDRIYEWTTRKNKGTNRRKVIENY